MSMQTNGQVRKSLSSQIDRLDSMLDGLADNLNDAVAADVKEAVRSVLKEVLASPELSLALHRSRLVATPEMAAPSEPAPAIISAGGPVRRAWHWLGRQVLAVVHAGCSSLRWAKQTCGAAIHGVENGYSSGWQYLRGLASAAWEKWQMFQWLTGPVLIALAIGAGVGIAAYSAEPVVAAITSGVGGFVTTLAVQASVMFRRLWSIGLASDEA